jgi:Na+/phosphate symporter
MEDNIVNKLKEKILGQMKLFNQVKEQPKVSIKSVFQRKRELASNLNEQKTILQEMSKSSDLSKIVNL